jgi:hypothetical protein
VKKFIPAALFLILVYACDPVNKKSKPAGQKDLNNQKRSASESYKPGLGEFMTSIQMHHAKLWFAGTNENWELANFETKELKETVEDIRRFQPERRESKLITILLNEPLDSLSAAIQREDPVLFRRSFLTLTNTCNQCLS